MADSRPKLYAMMPFSPRMAIIEAMFFQQLVNIGQVPVSEVFLDLKKAYNMLKQGMNVGNPLGCWGGRQSMHPISMILDTDASCGTSTLWSMQWYGTGYPRWSESSKATGLGQTVTEKLTITYAMMDWWQRMIMNGCQQAIEVLSGLFEQVGLRTNIKKIKHARSH